MDLQMGLCGVTPTSAYTHMVPSTREECNSFQVWWGGVSRVNGRRTVYHFVYLLISSENEGCNGLKPLVWIHRVSLQFSWCILCSEHSGNTEICIVIWWNVPGTFLHSCCYEMDWNCLLWNGLKPFALRITWNHRSGTMANSVSASNRIRRTMHQQLIPSQRMSF